MKKYSFLVYHREYTEFLKNLQELGVLHVNETISGEIENEELRENYQLLHQINDNIKFLQKRDVEQKDDAGDKDGESVVKELIDLRTDKEQYIQQEASIRKELSQIEPWGDFSWESIHKLADAGLKTRFIVCPSRKYEEEIREKYFVESINELSGHVYFVLFEKINEPVEIDAEDVQLPKVSLSKLKSELENINGIFEKTEGLFDKYASKFIPLLERASEKISGQLSFDKVVLNTKKEAEDKLMILEGWAPTDKIDALDAYLNDQAIYFESENPTPKDNPPIKLKNNKFTRLYEAIGELYTFPNYSELDLTPFFAPFYMLFFGFCLGDAGYGLIITIATIYGLFKVKPKLKPLLKLGMYLGIATTIMGAAGGTIFGINLIDTGYKLTPDSYKVLKSEVPQGIYSDLLSIQDINFEKKAEFVKKLDEVIGVENTSSYKNTIIKSSESKYTFLDSFRYLLLDSDTLMYMALLLGYIQVLFGMFINAANKARMFGFKYSLSQLGWNIIVMIAIPVFALGKFDIINKEIANKIALVTLITGGLPALFYNSPGKNPLLNFGVGLWDTYQTASGLLGDVLSYIRLFALGISSAILGNVFNSLALQTKEGLSGNLIGSILGILLMILILTFGHGLNFFMAILGSFVHPLRLTFVEFYKNAGFIGGGKKYEPFKK